VEIFIVTIRYPVGAIEHLHVGIQFVLLKFRERNCSNIVMRDDEGIALESGGIGCNRGPNSARSISCSTSGGL
jgi:hypothetical protein